MLRYVCDGVEQVKATGWFGGHVVAIGERENQAEDGQVYAISALSFSHICHVAAVEAIAAGFRDVVERGRLKGRYGGPKVVRRCYPARVLLRVLSSEVCFCCAGQFCYTA